MEKNISVVLVRPESDGNIGAVCRAMKTTDLRSLRIVGRKSFDSNEIRTFALHAFDLFEKAMLFSTLAEAAAGTALNVGFTRRKGKRRKYISYPPELLPEKIKAAPGAGVNLIFGNEEHGLTDEELGECDMAVEIPSSENFPSYNLSHAVQIAGYLLFSAKPGDNNITDDPPADRGELTRITEEITDALREIGFYSFSGDKGKEEMSRFFRDILARAMISPEEGERLVSIFRKASGLSQRD